MNDLTLVDLPRFDFYGATTRGLRENEIAEEKRAHDLNYATAVKATESLAKFSAARAKLDEQERALALKESAELQKIRDYNVLITDLTRARESLDLGRNRFEILKAEIDGRIDYLHSHCWGASEAHQDTNGHPAIISKFYTNLAGVERAVADFPAWQSKQVARISQLETEATAFAKANGINPGNQ